MRIRPLALVLAFACAVTLSSCGDDGSSGSSGSSTSSGAAESGPCQYPTDGSQPAKEVEPPPSQPTASGDVAVTIATSAGDIDATLDAAATPCTVNSFLSLADQGYFDGTQCHRLTTQGIFVLQCGDPTGSGAGGPGYSFPDELSGKESYPAGTLAMANAGPDTNGSQFFLVYEDTQLPPSYTVFGQMSDAGVDVVKKVAAKGTANGSPDGPPKTEVKIESVTTD